ncbi:MAG: glycosyltransferase [Alphaproteobacteria bacterium]|nr:glycosyltransferase [Alphaproteobacteria bacterium]
MPKVSVIIPVYNVEKYLSQCLDSVLKQTLTDIEFICVNDGSADQSAEILNAYAAKDKRIKVINQPNGGYGKAINAGLDAATGEYIGILESDDWADENMYADLYKIAAENNLDVVKADFYKAWSDGRKKRVCVGKDGNYNKVFRLEPQRYIPRIWGSIWSALYKRDFLLKNDIRVNETGGASYQDTGFIFKTNICAERMMLTDGAYLNYRQDNLESSVKNRDKIFSLSNEYEEIARYLRQHQLAQWQNLYMLRRCEGCFWNLSRLSASNRPLYLQKEKKFLLSVSDNNAVEKMGLSRKKIRKLKLLKFSENLFLQRHRVHDLMLKIRSLI